MALGGGGDFDIDRNALLTITMLSPSVNEGDLGKTHAKIMERAKEKSESL